MCLNRRGPTSLLAKIRRREGGLQEAFSTQQSAFSLKCTPQLRHEAKQWICSHTRWTREWGTPAYGAPRQLTSRSGVLKAARSRVVIGENARGGRGLAGAVSTQPKDAVWV